MTTEAETPDFSNGQTPAQGKKLAIKILKAAIKSKQYVWAEEALSEVEGCDWSDHQYVENRLDNVILFGFDWEKSEKGHYFWDGIHIELCEAKKKSRY